MALVALNDSAHRERDAARLQAAAVDAVERGVHPAGSQRRAGRDDKALGIIFAPIVTSQAPPSRGAPDLRADRLDGCVRGAAVRGRLTVASQPRRTAAIQSIQIQPRTAAASAWRCSARPPVVGHGRTSLAASRACERTRAWSLWEPHDLLLATTPGCERSAVARVTVALATAKAAGSLVRVLIPTPSPAQPAARASAHGRHNPAESRPART